MGHISSPIVKHSYVIWRAEDIARSLPRLFTLRDRSPYSVLIDIPKDIAQKSFEYSPDVKIDLPGYQPKVKGYLHQIAAAIALIS
ncbi:MAG: hypothetical protein M1G31_23135 [Pseudanabaena sp. Salubria-1]|nr:hypothetical protein [Pseudanabaena sp. Salubria-1]